MPVKRRGLLAGVFENIRWRKIENKITTSSENTKCYEIKQKNRELKGKAWSTIPSPDYYSRVQIIFVGDG